MRHLLLVCVFGFGCGSSKGADDPSNDPPPYQPPYAACSGGQMPSPPASSLCLSNPTAPTGSPPIAVIEHEFVAYMGVPAVHIRVVFDPAFADNTYGVNAIGWKTHTFKDLVGSDHATIAAVDVTGAKVLEFDLDYITADASAPCGYRCLGVDGGEGKMLFGPRSAVLGWTTSLDQNLNERGYCSYITDSPATDESCTPNPAAPDWDFRVVYEVWLAESAFPNMFGSAYMSFVHASPSKLATNTVTTQPGECPCTSIDPGDCAPPPGGSCTTSDQCPTEQFCYNSQCIPTVLE